MLSNPTNIQQRQRQHRRQQSTPTIFEATKVSNLPTVQRHGSHRRGMSLDQRQRRRSPPQDITPVIYTNQGFNDNQQQILRETQQQRLARPGQEDSNFNNPTNDENYHLISPLVTPQRQNFDAGCLTSYGVWPEFTSPLSPYSANFNTTSQVNQNDYSDGSQFLGNDSLLFSSSGNVTPSAFFDFSMAYDESSGQQDWGATIRPSLRTSAGRRVSGGIADRVARFEGLGAEDKTPHRPITPPSVETSSRFPPTPATTPFNRSLKVEAITQRFSDSYDTSMEKTIKPARKRSNQRAQTIFQEMRDLAERSQPPSPPGSTPLPTISKFETSAPMPKSSRAFLKVDYGTHDGLSMELKHTGYESSNCSPTHSNLTPAISQHSSPELSHASLHRADFDHRSCFEPPSGDYHLPESLSDMDLNDPTSPTRRSYHQRSESVDSINIDESITDTGITIDDIAHYIHGPDPVDQKWVCIFPDCGKRFGRKENIKSHVQTHLGDRQFQCPHCKKCFVRQHDLKRHAKIHSGIKPYPCACGNSFARHDALTRHRQRGMCIGAFEGVVKKIVKRGRPRKARPDHEERLEKSSKTRGKNRVKAISAASSPSAYSESSSGRTPPDEHDVLDDKPFGDFTHDFRNSAQHVGGDFQYSPTASPLPTDCVSPQAMLNAPSPSVLSTHSGYSHASNSQHSHRDSVVSVADLHSFNAGLPSHGTSPAKSTISQYNTPPELCLSSSPPPSSRFYEPCSQEMTHDMDLSKIAQLHNMNVSDQDDDMFLENFGSSANMSMGLLEQDSDMVLGSKFDDSFGVVSDNEDMLRVCDVFFGSP